MDCSTKEQRDAVRYCEHWLCIEFEGNIKSYRDCSAFLRLYLKEAKQAAIELTCEYEAYLWSFD